jgi:hypothetical protein
LSTNGQRTVSTNKFLRVSTNIPGVKITKTQIPKNINKQAIG